MQAVVFEENIEIFDAKNTKYSKACIKPPPKVSALPDGTYLLHILDGNLVYVREFVKR